MPDPTAPDSQNPEASESFKDILSQFEQGQAPKTGSQARNGVVVSVSSDSVLVDIGLKTEGIMPLTAFGGAAVKTGDKVLVTIKGRDLDGYYELTRGKVERPTDWDALERAFNNKTTIVGTVTSAVKGGLRVDVGVPAFMPASRTGTRDAAEMEKLVGQEIRCRITKLDVTEEDVVVDRRVIAEEEEGAARERRISEVKEGDVVNATVRNLADYGAFVDIGGVDALLHVSDISWQRVSAPADVLAPGQQIEVKVLKIDPAKRRISVGMKQLQAHPWDAAAKKFNVGERVRGVVTRLMEFGAFVELEPGVEGLIHISEMSWGRKIKRASELVKPGETVEVVILGVNTAERRIALGLKQALGDPWAEASQKFVPGTVVEGPITSVQKFGAFVQIVEGVEGMIHVSEISADKHINHPQDVLGLGQVVKAQVLAVDSEKRQVKLSMKQLVPTGLDEYIAEHKPGDVVTGRWIDQSGEKGRVELGEGILAACRIGASATAGKEAASTSADLSSLTAMLQARWKSGATSTSQNEPVRAGQVRSFRITKVDPSTKAIELELA